MADREKVLKGLECCSDITVKRRHKCLKECPYDFVKNDNCMEDMARDALELLKEQQETIVSFQGTINKLNAALAEQPEQKFFVDSDGKITPLPIHSQWISVKDKLPDDASDVIAYYDCGDNGHVMFVNYYKKCWYDAVFNDLIDDLDQGCITHWMPLPEPPKEVCK